MPLAQLLTFEYSCSIVWSNNPIIPTSRIFYFQLWKGFAQRRKTREERQNEMMFIGMVAPPLPTNPKQIPQNMVSGIASITTVTSDQFNHFLLCYKGRSEIK